MVDVPAPAVKSGNPYNASAQQVVEDTLYFVSADDALMAVDLNRDTEANRRIRWTAPLPAPVSLGRFLISGSQIYVGLQTGDVLFIDKTSGAVRLSRNLGDRNSVVAYAGNDIVLCGSDHGVVALDPATGNTLWEKPNLAGGFYFNGLVLASPSVNQFIALDAATGSTLWQAAGSPPWVEGDSLYIIEPGGLKEYTLNGNASQEITSKEAMTELAGVLISKGDLEEAARFTERVARESDPNYPPLHYVQARLHQARGDLAAAQRELVLYTDLVGRQSKAAQDVNTALKRNAGLLWMAQLQLGDAGTNYWGSGERGSLAAGKMIARSGAQLVALDTDTGRILWRQNAENPRGSLYDSETRRFFYGQAQKDDSKVVRIYTVGIDSGVRKEFAKITAVNQQRDVRYTFSNGHLFVGVLTFDPQSGMSTFDTYAFDQASGKELWRRAVPITGRTGSASVGLFHAQGDFVVFSSGRSLRILQNGSDYATY